MISLLLMLIIWFLVGFDAKLTIRRMNQYGTSIEVNRGLRWLSEKTSPEVAAILLLLAPNAFWCGLFYKLGWSWALGALAGFKLRFWFNQLESLAFERQVKEIAKIINGKDATKK